MSAAQEQTDVRREATEHRVQAREQPQRAVGLPAHLFRSAQTGNPDQQGKGLVQRRQVWVLQGSVSASESSGVTR